jgi:hypothetical protein
VFTLFGTNGASSQKSFYSPFKTAVPFFSRSFVSCFTARFAPRMPTVSRLIVLIKFRNGEFFAAFSACFLARFGVVKRPFFAIYEHFHRLIEALARLPFGLFSAIGRILAQNDFLRPASALVFGLGAGALSLLPVARLYFARPFAVNPAPLETGCFSPRPTDKLTDLRAIIQKPR